jgi:tetratricopeptide (TPR) repeat protein
VELGKLQASAHKILEQRRLEKEQRAVLARLRTSARNDMEKHRFKPAYRTLRQMLELEPGNSEALALRQQAETALAAKRQKIRRVLPIAAGLLLAVAIGAGGLLTYRGRKGAEPSSPSVEGKSQAPVSAIEVPLPPVVTQPARDPKITQGLEMASNYLKTKKYSEAAREAKGVLELSPGNSEAESLFRRAQENLDEMAAANRQAKSLMAAGKFEEAITSLRAVLQLAPSDPEARKLLKELDRYARKGADEAMTQSKLARAASEAAKAPDLVRNLFDTARGVESEAMALYKAKQFGQATAKFSESREAYQHAATEARSRIETEQQRQQAAQQEQTLKMEREHKVLAQQQASQREAVQNARQAYDHARDKASQAGAETRALEPFRQATALASEAQAKLDKGDLRGAQHDFEVAASAMEQTAETISRQSQVEAPDRARDAAQKESDRRGVEEALRGYKTAWESKDLDRLKTLWPGLDGGTEKKLKQTFEFSRSIKIDLQLTNISITRDAATVICQRQDRTVTVTGDKLTSKPFKTTITLRRTGSTWVIEDVH